MLRKRFIRGIGTLGAPAHAGLREAGDTARNRGDWAGAASAYRAFLEGSPGNAAIWVQLGHACKESGQLDAAEDAYRRAVALQPDSADAHLQLGHLLKVTGRVELAATSYMDALALERNKDALSELQGLGYAPDDTLHEPVHERTSRRCLDIGDLLTSLSTHATVTGISRVQLGLLSHLFDGMPPDQAGAYEFVFQDAARAQAHLAEKALVRRVFEAAAAPRVDVKAVAALVARVRHDAPAVEWQAGDLYFVPGSFWTVASNPEFIPGLKAQGVRLAAYVYDLIPITHPQFCEAGLTEGFTAAFAEMVPYLDFVLTISDFVSREVTRFLAQQGLRGFPALPAPLAHEMGGARPPARPSAHPAQPHAGAPSRPATRVIPDALHGRDYVLCVGTIEARKNHVYLFYLWQRLLEEGVAMPDLVLVGQYGWRVTDLVSQLQASRFLGGRIHVLNGVGDQELAALYSGCLFTVFPSFVEGWGLPVGESLARGKVPVASSTTSVPEVGGEFAVYIDPYNLHSGLDAVRTLVTDPAQRAAREAAIRERFVPRSWQAAAAHFFAQVDAGLRAPSGGGGADDRPGTGAAGYAPPLPAGRLLDVGSLAHPCEQADYLQRPLRLMFTGGWRPFDSGGAWIKDHLATLRFQSDCPPGSDVVLFLHFVTVPWVEGNHLTIRAKEPPATPLEDQRFAVRRKLRPGHQFWQTVRGAVLPDGAVEVTIRVDGPVRANPPDEPRALCIRLVNVGYAPADQPEARMEMMERVLCL